MCYCVAGELDMMFDDEIISRLLGGHEITRVILIAQLQLTYLYYVQPHFPRGRNLNSSIKLKTAINLS